jgi:SAM-dependent methyltransferase
MKSTGIITADPNPIRLRDDQSLGATTLTWTSEITREVEVRVGAPDGQLLSRTGPYGSVVTGDWVSDGMTFFLQNVSNRLPLTPDNTLATIAVKTAPRVKQPGPDVPPVGGVNFGDFRRVSPISAHWGLDRGRPVDRYYIENFLAAHSADVRGRVLAIGDDGYTRMFGGDRVTQSDVLHVEEGNPMATIIGDLTDAPHIPSDAFDCILCPQTLQLIYDVPAAIRTMHRILKPGGVLLATFPGISQTYDREWGSYWCWNFTPLSAQRLFEKVFPPEHMKIEAHGNVLTAIAFLQGLAAEELRQEEFDHRDTGYDVSITTRAVKAAKRR